MARKKIPLAIESEVMFLSDLKCCVDGKKGDHIHHIDGDNANNTIDNLALLCFDCHNLATITGSLSKKLSHLVIKKYREHHYLVVKTKREDSLQSISGGRLEPLTQEDLIEATTTSLILIEMARIQDEYYKESRMDRTAILQKILVFKHQSNPRILMTILSFLNRVVYETRNGLPSSMLDIIEEIIGGYLSNLSSRTTPKQLFHLANMALNVCRTIVYDTSIHSNNFKSMSIGYHIISSIYDLARSHENKDMEKSIINLFEGIKSQLQRPERNDLENAERMRLIHFEALGNNGFKYPPEIKALIQQEK